MIGFSFPDELFSDEAQTNTPDRLRRMMEEFAEWRDWELDRGLFEKPGYNDLVVLKDIEFTSFCDHHLMQFSGHVSVAYLPNGWIVGLSKIPRIVKKFASRPQLQEQLTDQIADYLMEKVPEIAGCMVVCSANHTCMSVRGVRSTGTTVTSAIRGKFRDDEGLKSEASRMLGL